jgi:hypothetical protein
MRSVFGFFKDKKDAGADYASSTWPRWALDRRTTTPAGYAGVRWRDMVNGSVN